MVLQVDNFNAGDLISLGPDWTTAVDSTTASDGWRRGPSYAFAFSDKTAVAVRPTAPASGDQFAQIVLGATGASVGVLVRSTVPSGPTGTAAVGVTAYLARHNGSSVAIVKLTGATSTSLASAPHARADGQQLRLVAQGSTLTAYIDGQQIATATDASLTDGTVGFRAGGTASARVDDFYGGTLAEMADVPGATVTPPAPQAPGQVGTLTTSAPTTTGVTVSWPAVSGATGYAVEYRPGTTGAWLAGPTTTTAMAANLTGLTAATVYQVRVTATNSVGPGTPSVAAPFTTASAPASSAPTYRWPMLDANNVLPARFSASTPVTTVTRDARGRVTSVTEDGITETYARNSAGQVTTITRSGTTRTIARSVSGQITGVN